MVKKLRIGIDASNISSGGGLTHLVELLKVVNPSLYGFNKVIVWAPSATLNKIISRKWLKIKSNKFLEKNIFFRVIWQKYFLESEVIKENCDLLFVPGGSFVTKFRPIITMNQNLLPFEWDQIKRYGISLYSLKWLLLRYSQKSSFKKANGVIFLSQYAMNIVYNFTQEIVGRRIIISHGLESVFFIPPRTQFPISQYSENNPFKIIYVSSLDPYKNNETVIKAVAILRESGLPVSLSIFGRGSKKNKNKINKQINYYDKNSSIKYHGSIPHSDLRSKYNNANIAIYASSCETFGQTLIEGMAAGLPTLCANNSTMPEILGSAGVYFDINNFKEMLDILKNFIMSPELREKKAKLAFQKANNYSWDKCANETFKFFELIAKDKLNY